MKIVQTHINYSNLYRDLDVNSLVVGDVLTFNIFIKRDSNYVIIIESGTELSQRLYEQLQLQDKLYISKKEEDNQALTSKTLLTYIKYNKNDIEKSLNFIYEINKTFFDDYLNSKDDTIDLNYLGGIINSIVYLVDNNKNYLKDTIPYFSDSSTLPYHSLHVSIYSVGIAKLVGLNDKQLTQIGTAAILHDIGIKKIDQTILNKNSKLDIQESETVQKHPQYSREIAYKNYVDDSKILDAILHHHESYDGTGYPDNLTARNISDFTSILSISDSFDALTNDRPYRKKYSTFDALKIMMKDKSMIKKFNQKYLQIFLKSFLKETGIIHL